MFKLFQHFRSKNNFNKVFSQALKLAQSAKIEDKEVELEKFSALLKEQPMNPYLRRKMLMLGEKLRVSVLLPEAGSDHIKCRK